MTAWRPRAASTFDAPEALSDQERIVLAELDGSWSAEDLSREMGMELETIGEILASLSDRGAIAWDDEAGTVKTAAADAASTDVDATASELAAPSETETETAASHAHVPSTRPSTQAGATAESVAPESASSETAADSESGETTEEEPDDATSPEDEIRTHRQLYELRFRPLGSDARMAFAREAHGDDLLALCFDADPHVIHAVLENPTSGLAHARLIAVHHKNPAGLALVLARPELARDALVQRRMLRNDQLSEALLGRILGHKPMITVFHLSNDRDVPERTRMQARPLLRRKFARSASEERADLVVRTEGRALGYLTGQTFDARTTSILCARTITSITLVQNLARFGPCPPLLLVHLAKLPMVRRQPALKKLVMQHANMPSEIKRQLG